MVVMFASKIASRALGAVFLLLASTVAPAFAGDALKPLPLRFGNFSLGSVMMDGALIRGALMSGAPFETYNEANIIFAASSAADAPSDLLAHRAVYDLTLSESKFSNIEMKAQGRMAFDFSGSACEGYTTNFRQVLEIEGDDGAARLSDMRYSTFEDAVPLQDAPPKADAAIAQSYRYSYVNRTNGAVEKAISGFGEKRRADWLNVTVTSPKDGHFEVKEPVLFPTEHQIHILKAARAGEQSLSALVYDGSEDGARLFQTLTVIGKARMDSPEGDDVFGKPPFAGMAYWPVTISYYAKPMRQTGLGAAQGNAARDDASDEAAKNETGAAKNEILPDYIQKFDLYDNGVIRAPKFDYGSFIIEGKLHALEVLPQHLCMR